MRVKTWLHRALLEIMTCSVGNKKQPMNGSTVESPLSSHEHNSHFCGAHNIDIRTTSQNSVPFSSEPSHSFTAVGLFYFLALSVG